MGKQVKISILVITLMALWSCQNDDKSNDEDFIYHLNNFFALFFPDDYNSGYNEYIEKSTDCIIKEDTGAIDIQTITLLNHIYTDNDDSFNACASNMVLGIVSYRNAVQDSALFYLLTAEQYSDSRPELKPHIYYYLASTFMEFDPILAHDIIYSHPKERIDRYDYSRFMNVRVSQQEMDAHNVNSIYYSRLLQRSLDAQEEQHQKEKRLYRFIIISVSLLFVLTLLSIIRMMWFRRKTVNLADSVANQKINFNNLLEKYMELYSTKCDGNTIARDANEMLSVLRKKYPLTSSDIAIIWLILLSFDKDKICSTLSISSDYYYQRRCKIRQTLNFESTKNLNCDLKSFVPKYLSEHASTIT